MHTTLDIGPVLAGKKIAMGGVPNEFYFRVRRGLTGSLIDVYRFHTQDAAEHERARMLEEKP